jgi:hypothetical protein
VVDRLSDSNIASLFASESTGYAGAAAKMRSRAYPVM